VSVNRIAAVSSALVVAVAVTAGLWISGAPQTQRLERADERRLADLRSLTVAVQDYHDANGELPDRLQVLVDGIRLSELPLDPLRGEPYDYAREGTTAFRLCARFDRPSPPQSSRGFWRHGAGHHCFDFRLDGDAAAGR